MPKISFVTTCKGRLHHLKKTLPLMVAQSPEEILVVDYGCPDKVGEWVNANFPEVKVVHVDDDSGFCAARARNIGASATKSQWLCFVDADINISAGWVMWLKQNLNTNGFYRAGLVNGVRDSETHGTMLCTREAFNLIGGYDEVIRGAGIEDKDFYERLSLLGLYEREYPSTFIFPIRHSDDERVTFNDIKDKKQKDTIDTCYFVAKKYFLSKLNIKNISLIIRRSIMDQIKQQYAISAYKGIYRLTGLSINLSVRCPSCEEDVLGTELCIRIVRRRRYLLFGPSRWHVIAN